MTTDSSLKKNFFFQKIQYVTIETIMHGHLYLAETDYVVGSSTAPTHRIVLIEI